MSEVRRDHRLTFANVALLLFVFWVGGGCGDDDFNGGQPETIGTSAQPFYFARQEFVGRPPLVVNCPQDGPTNHFPTSCCNSSGVQIDFDTKHGCGSSPGGPTTDATVTTAAAVVQHVQ